MALHLKRRFMTAVLVSVTLTFGLTACARVLERTYVIIVDGISYTVNEYSLAVVGLEDSQRITEVIVNGVPVSCEYFDFVTDCETAVRNALAQGTQAPWDEDEAQNETSSGPEPYSPPGD